MSIGLLILELHLAGCGSLKEKRSRLKPLMARLHNQFNVSVAEVDHLDVWQSSVVACTLVSNDPNHTRRALQKIVNWVETNWRAVEVVDSQIELL